MSIVYCGDQHFGDIPNTQEKGQHKNQYFEVIYYTVKGIVCACAILKDGPVCYGTSRLKSWVCAVTVTRCALLRTPTLKSNKR